MATGQCRYRFRPQLQATVAVMVADFPSAMEHVSTCICGLHRTAMVAYFGCLRAVCEKLLLYNVQLSEMWEYDEASSAEVPEYG